MTYTIHSLIQGMPEWHAHRTNCHNASDLSAAMGISRYKSRTDLIRQMATGITPEIDAATQRRFDDGHRFEALARSITEKIIGKELYPITVSAEVDGLAKRLSASLDGATDDDSTNFEHKSLNADLSAALDRGIIPEEYWPQMEQGMLINGATRCLFMASKWDDNDNLIEEKHCWYESRPELRAKIIPTWRQIEEDEASYQHVETVAVPIVAAIDELPALTVELVGSVTASNMADWKGLVAARIQAINTDLKTDEDFAIAEKTVKFLGDGEKKLEMVKSQALSQTASIDELFRTIDSLSAEMKTKRLNLDKLVKARKESIRMEIMQDAQAKLAKHVKALNERIGWHNGSQIISSAADDFALAIKGKKSVASLRDACDTELARAKIATSEIADRIESNRKAMGDHERLFPDFAQVCTKALDDFTNLVAMRVQQQKEAEAKREEETRQRIRAEEEARAAAKVKAEQEEIERQRRESEDLAAKVKRESEMYEAAQARIQAEKQKRIDDENARARAAMESSPVHAVINRLHEESQSAAQQDQPAGNAETIQDDPWIWRSMRNSVGEQLDSLTVYELEMVADYINRKAWRKAA